MLMLRIGPIIVFKLYLKIFNPKKMTRRDFVEGPLNKAPIKYEVLIPKMLYLVAIQLTFLVISPILLIVSGLMFSGLFLAWKYQLCYVITPTSQMGGMLWYRIYKYAMTALMASSITMIGYMGIKEGFAQSALLIPLPFIIKFVWNSTVQKFETISLDLAHSEAVDVDLRTGKLFMFIYFLYVYIFILSLYVFRYVSFLFSYAYISLSLPHYCYYYPVIPCRCSWKCQPLF